MNAGEGPRNGGLVEKGQSGNPDLLLTGEVLMPSDRTVQLGSLQFRRSDLAGNVSHPLKVWVGVRTVPSIRLRRWKGARLGDMLSKVNPLD